MTEREADDLAAVVLGRGANGLPPQSLHTPDTVGSLQEFEDSHSTTIEVDWRNAGYVIRRECNQSFVLFRNCSSVIGEP